MRQAPGKSPSRKQSPKPLLANEQQINSRKDCSSPRPPVPCTHNDSKMNLTLHLDDQPFAPTTEPHPVPMHRDIESVTNRWTHSLTLDTHSASQSFYEQSAPQEQSWAADSQYSGMQQQPMHFEQHSASRYSSFDGSVMEYGPPVTNPPVVRQDLATGWSHNYMTSTSPTMSLQPSPSSAMAIQPSPVHHRLPIQLPGTDCALPEHPQHQQMVFAAHWETPRWESTPAAYHSPNHFHPS
jgi:hypothetical protein